MTLDEALASGRHVVSYGAGFMTAFGMTKIIAPDVLVSSFDHIFNGIKEIAVGVGPLAGAGMAWWATHKSTKAAQVATVSAMPEVKQITVSDPALATAAKQASPATQVTLAPPLVITPKGAAT
jgi:hypothetical protein